MKIIVVLATVLAVALAADTYNPAYDSFNAQEVVENDRLLESYLRCFLGEGPCTAEGKDFKKKIPEAMKTGCGKCTPKQRELARIMIKAFQTKFPEMWEKLTVKVDPTREYKETLDKFLNSSD